FAHWRRRTRTNRDPEGSMSKGGGCCCRAGRRAPWPRGHQTRCRTHSCPTGAEPASFLLCLGIDCWHRLQITQGTQDHDRAAILVLGRCFDLIARQRKGNRVAFRIAGGEMQRLPVDSDLSTADAEETAEVDHRGARLPLAVDDDIDEATHVFPGTTADALTEDRLHLLF